MTDRTLPAKTIGITPPIFAPQGDVMVMIGGKSFRCECGCNVFRHYKDDPNLYKCNSCEAIYRGN